MSLSTLAWEYTHSRLQDPTIVGWVAGGLALLTSAYATSPGRELVKRNPPPRISRVMVAAPESPRRKDDVAGLFYPSRTPVEKFLFLLRISIPSWACKEMRVIALLTSLMLLRAGVSVRIAKRMGILGRSVIHGDMRSLLWAIVAYLIACVPASVLNVSLDYYSQILDLYFRENLTKYFHARYLSDKVFFRIAGLHEVDLVDQRITQDIQRWSVVSSHLFTSFTRPLSESVIFTCTLATLTGWQGPAITWGFYAVYLVVYLRYAPNMDWLADQRLRKEGQFHAAHQELLSYAEEITVGQGIPFQKALLSNFSTEMTNQTRLATFVHARFNMFVRLYGHHGAGIVGYAVSWLALLRQRIQKALSTTEDLISMYAEASYSFGVLSKAIMRLVWNVKLLLVINGYTQRLFQLVEALERAEEEVNLQNDRTSYSPQLSTMDLFHLERGRMLPEECFGRVVHGDHIELVDAPLTLPTGEVLCPSLSFYVKAGMNVLVMGPNGCGKSSTFRLLGELWPLRGGRMIKPSQDQMHYVPQRPYMYDGTLFEQVIYPLKRKHVSASESDLHGCLELARLDYILSRPRISWDSRLSWTGDVLSAGEKQRLAMARLFFHRPRFAILDECSSLLDLDIEADLYNTCRALGISLITIAHRRSVWGYHNWILQFDGNGGYLFSPLAVDRDSGTLFLTNVTCASDPSVIGTEVVINVSKRWEDELESAQVEV